jgi:two-component system nitrate/nitrite response regulator NarL
MPETGPRERGAGSTLVEGSFAVAVASATPATADGLAGWLSRGRLDVVAVCTGQEDLVRAIRARRPALIVATHAPGDPFWPHVLRGEGEPWPALLLLSDTRPEDEVALLRAGAAGVFPLRSTRAHLLRAVRELLAGRTVASAAAVSLLLEAPQGPELSSRQAEILVLLAEGRATGEIAKLLFVEPTTVKTHVARMCRMLDLPGRAALVREAPGILQRLARDPGTTAQTTPMSSIDALPADARIVRGPNGSWPLGR